MSFRPQRDLTSVIRILVLLGTVGLLPACSVSQNTGAVALQKAIAQKPSEQDESSAIAVVKSLKANLRDKPSRSGAVVRAVEKDNRLALINPKPVGPWYRVRDQGTGSEGWIHGNTIAFINNSSTNSASGFERQSEAAVRPRRVTKAGFGRSYINVDGERVSSPIFSSSRPAGASARCRDGSYSFSQNRRGTCSHHGGVAVWF